MTEHVYTYATSTAPEQHLEVCASPSADRTAIYTALAQRVGGLATFRYARTATAGDAALPFVSSPPPPRTQLRPATPTAPTTPTAPRAAPARAPSPATAPAASAAPAASWDAVFARLDSEHEADDEHEQDGSTERAPRPWDEVFDDLDAAHDREDTADVDARDRESWARAFERVAP